MNEQLNMITPKQIQEIIDSFKEEDRPLAARLMQRMTQFGNMNSLNTIFSYLTERNGTFSRCDSVSMNTVMNYLANYKYLFSHPMDGSNLFCILDKIALENLENKTQIPLIL